MPSSEELARERTKLANERTLLAYLRTGLAIGAAGFSVIAFIDAPAARAGGWLLAATGFLTLVIGFVRFRSVARRL